MRRLLPLILTLLLPPLSGVRAQEVVPCTPDDFLAQVAARRGPDGRLRPGSCFRLAPGHYHLAPAPYREARCGNCEDPATPVDATVGLRLAGEDLRLEGDPRRPEAVVIHTHAGYGLLWRGVRGGRLSGVTVTDGARDPDGRATCAAVVVEDAELEIEDCILAGNLGDSALVVEKIVGVMGVAGREGARVTLRRCRILRNSWDGVALYRGAEALIEDCLVDGVDKAGGRTLGGGRGVGIGVTWDARATIRRCRVTRYWKGIGVFVDARAEVTDCVVEELLTWGIALWDAGRGRPAARIERNVVYDTGACGISLAREAAGEPEPGSCRENVVARTGVDPRYDDPELYCRQCPVAVDALPPGFRLHDNWLFANRRALPAGAPAGEPDLDEATFVACTEALLADLSQHAALAGSRALRELPRRRVGVFIRAGEDESEGEP
ncbi:MAG: right-handed parallel beta-helix repeat-containing protein [Candidatus Krumholzibacteriota bacterium]|nr:right-handed parallel beta-helix repeat-containing protein [Candidatus Krumholzibacteriota bacterium]